MHNLLFVKIFMMNRVQCLFLFLALSIPMYTVGQTAYFVDGFHGGIWGHYPEGYTRFITDQLDQHPKWNISLEIEPETWDLEKKHDNVSYQKLKQLLNNNLNNRVEYVNPTYAQPYLFNISGESMIRQFAYGIAAIKGHFPNIRLVTYSSEEPCFTSALPQILTSFGFKYASLKNPNTCWGGYTRAHGGELVKWEGSDGTSILTVPRYEFESLMKNSTWETIANANSPEFIRKALDFGIKAPVGMCLQDAGWRLGPWLKKGYYQPTEYTTWTNYFENIVKKENVPGWKLSQEDIQVSLVWGAQVLQKLAQEVRVSENKIVQAEKTAVINKLAVKENYPEKDFDTAWRTLMLAQHHDCWIVPYNGPDGDTWADKVKVWTDFTDRKSDSILNVLSSTNDGSKTVGIQVYNTLGRERTEWVEAALPSGYSVEQIVVLEKNGKPQPLQLISGKKGEKNLILFKATVPAFGYSVYQINKAKNPKRVFANVKVGSDGEYLVETDLYKIVIDAKKGGVIKNLIAKKLGKDFVDQTSERKFNELRGNFYKKGGFRSSTENEAKIEVLQNGAGKLAIAIQGFIAAHPFTQTLTLTEGQSRIDLNVKIDWLNNEGIGEFEEVKYKDTAYHKAFYNDRYKLLTLFPLSLKNQKVSKNAPYDITESKLSNTFFSTWDSIKNNIILNWVDVASEDGQFGMALYTDHTTSYAHGADAPLGLNVQYSGKGLWGRDYKIEGATSVNYSLVPHAGNWEKAGLSFENEKINEPLYAVNLSKLPKKTDFEKSFIEIDNKDCVLSSCTFKGNDLYVRIHNTSRSEEILNLSLGFDVKDASWVDLNGNELEKVSVPKTGSAIKHIKINAQGIKTLKINKFSNNLF